MWILLIALVLLGIFSWMATHFNWFNSNRSNDLQGNLPVNNENSDVCCGMHEVCETDTLMNYKSKPEYYEDEELDVYFRKSPKEYSDEDIKLFESVFYTLRPEEVAGWLRSLQIREIELPVYLKEEALLIVSERRQIS